MNTAQETRSEKQRERLNDLYRFQRHFYDVTRRFFLFGRDEMLRQIHANPNERILEVGCGTGRNLLKLSSIEPKAKLYGLDASDQMLTTAGTKFDTRNKQKEIILRQGLAEEFNFWDTFHLETAFDKIFISYSLSMMPKWREALRNSLDNLKANGDLFILDFWDGSGLPGLFNYLRLWWLGLFRVYYRPEYLEFLKELQNDGAGRLTVTPVGSNYAFIAHFRKASGQ